MQCTGPKNAASKVNQTVCQTHCSLLSLKGKSLGREQIELPPRWDTDPERNKQCSLSSKKEKSSLPLLLARHQGLCLSVFLLYKVGGILLKV